jgi:arabinogalactan endo-1,4-beta-galactosidase
VSIYIRTLVRKRQIGQVFGKCPAFVHFTLVTLSFSASADWFDGGDISSLPVLEAHGAIFRSADGKPGDVVQIMRTAGANCFRLRLFVEPNGKNAVVNDLTYTLRLAQRAKKSGAALLLDFHYSDTWADPSSQRVPKSWSNLTGPALVQRVEDYTAATLRVFDRAGVLPELVQVGNEINHGMLWPYGKLNGADETAWNRFAELLRAGVRGVRKATPAGKRIRLIIHSASGGSVGETQAFAQKLQEYGVEYNVLGLSYYPWWSGTLDGLRQNVRRIIENFHKEVIVVETGYPWHRPDKDSKLNPGIRSSWTSWAWPPTPEGQEQFLRDIEAAVASAPQGRGLGVLWWYPESIPIMGDGYFHGDTAMFDPHGRALPALRAFDEH